MFAVGTLASGNAEREKVVAKPESVTFMADDFFKVSDAISPPVEYALSRQSKNLVLTLRIHSLQPDGGGISVKVGLSAADSVILDGTKAAVTRKGDTAEYTFKVPLSSLIKSEADWAKFRMGIAVSWAGGPFGEPRQMERFLHLSGAAADGLSPEPTDWAPIDLAEQATIVANRKNRIFIEFDQPMDGKASIVIENEKGDRVRNLISGKTMSKGRHRIEWDGFDERNNVVVAGNYRWRGVSHPGISPEYLFSFYNNGNPPFRNGSPTSNWLSDHTDPVATTTVGDSVFLGAPLSESGHALVQTDLEGNKRNHFSIPTLVGWGTLFLAADDECIYSIMEGNASYEPFQDLPDGKWQIRRPLNILRWTLKDGLPKKYDGARGEKVLTNNLYTSSEPKPKRGNAVPRPYNLGGAALLNGRLYVSLRQENRIVILNAGTGAEEGEISIQKPGLIAGDGKNLLVAFSEKSLVQIDPATRQIKPLFTPKLSAIPDNGDPEVEMYGFKNLNPAGITISPAQEMFLSDNGADQNIKVFNLQGKLLREIGKKGGRALMGPWEKSGMYRPHGITIDREGKLWVTETDSYPRRISVWNSQTGEFIKEIFGPGHYGADAGAFDIADHTRWIGGGVQWKLDFAKKTAEPVSTLYRQTQPGQLLKNLMGRYWNFYRKDGRTFLIAYGEGQPIYELRADGSAKLWALCGNLSALSQNPRWTLPKTIVDLPAVQALFKENSEKNRPPIDLTTEPTGAWNDKVKFEQGLMKNVSLLWVDKNGDDLGQPEEFEVLPSGSNFQISSWGAGNPTLDLRIPANLAGKPVLLNVTADGFLPSGAPNYSLAKAVETAVPVEPGMNGAETIQDRFGRQIFNSSPMKAVGPDGHELWSFPNKWIGVHGSHEAPLPQTGVMQGVLYFLGTAPLDDKAEAMIMNGNHGRFFVMTTDGIYLDEMFKDVRVTQVSDAYMIGGECFGGYFGKAEDGKYYLQSGHTDYRIFQIHGLEQLQRSEGSITVSEQQVRAAQSRHEQETAEKMQPKFAMVTEVPTNKKLSLNASQWPGVWSATWGNPAQPFPFVQTKMLRSGDRLYLGFRVKDPSPWKNQGTDWTMLFKSGDGVDFQFATDPTAKPNRKDPVPGDRRLLISQLQGKPIAVLYSYNEPGTNDPVAFSSPSRSVQVDRVTELKSAEINVVSGEGVYDIAISIPLADLGLPADGQAAEIRGDLGVIYGDSVGSMTVLRSYWSNQATGLVSDVPGEVSIAPSLWGTFKFNSLSNP